MKNRVGVGTMRETQGKTPAQGLLRPERRQVGGDQRQGQGRCRARDGRGEDLPGRGNLGTGADPTSEADSAKGMTVPG